VRKAAARSSLSEGGLAELEPKRGLALDWQKIDSQPASQPASQTGQARRWSSEGEDGEGMWSIVRKYK
jgi:hypothetical protein